MKILVFSDSHKKTELMERALSIHSQDTDLIIHLGDNAQDSAVFQKICPHIANINIFGNCDYFSHGVTAYDEKVLQLGKTQFLAFLTHGHSYCVNKNTDILFYKAKIPEVFYSLLRSHTYCGYFRKKRHFNHESRQHFKSERNRACFIWCCKNTNGIIMPSIIFDR